LAEVLKLPVVLTYGQTPDEATAEAQALALREVVSNAPPDQLQVAHAPT